MKMCPLTLLLAVTVTPLAAQTAPRATDTQPRFTFNYQIDPRYSVRFAYAYDPARILKGKQAIALTKPQIRFVESQTRQAMAEFTALQVRVRARQAVLDRLLEAQQVDEAAATAALEEVMQLENTIKRLRLTLLIRSKNALQPYQQRIQWKFGKADS